MPEEKAPAGLRTGPLEPINEKGVRGALLVLWLGLRLGRRGCVCGCGGGCRACCGGCGGGGGSVGGVTLPPFTVCTTDAT